MKDLIFYIQYKYYDFLRPSVITPLDLKEILEKCYGFQGAWKMDADEIIDLHLNFKENFNKAKIYNIMSNYEIYEAKGLAGELRKIIDLTIEQWIGR